MLDKMILQDTRYNYLIDILVDILVIIFNFYQIIEDNHFIKGFFFIFFQVSMSMFLLYMSLSMERKSLIKQRHKINFLKVL